MLLKLRERGLLLEVMDIRALVNPYADKVVGRLQWGEEQQDPELFAKDDLCFPSWEPLPLCWRDSQYRDEELIARWRGQ